MSKTKSILLGVSAAIAAYTGMSWWDTYQLEVESIQSQEVVKEKSGSAINPSSTQHVPVNAQVSRPVKTPINIEAPKRTNTVPVKREEARGLSADLEYELMHQMTPQEKGEYLLARDLGELQTIYERDVETNELHEELVRLEDEIHPDFSAPYGDDIQVGEQLLEIDQDRLESAEDNAGIPDEVLSRLNSANSVEEEIAILQELNQQQ